MCAEVKNRFGMSQSEGLAVSCFDIGVLGYKSFIGSRSLEVMDQGEYSTAHRLWVHL